MENEFFIRIDAEHLRNIRAHAAPKGISVCLQDGRGSPPPSLYSIVLYKSA